MGKTSNSGFGIGTLGSPQTNINQENYSNKISTIKNEKTESTNKNSDNLADGIKKLEKAGVKYTKEDVLFVSEDTLGNLVWLEKGNPQAGLEHILHGNNTSEGHAEDFKNAFGIDETQVPTFLKKVIENGKIVKNIKKSVGSIEGFERTFEYEGEYYIVTGIGTNGFIVSAYPTRKEKKKCIK